MLLWVIRVLIIILFCVVVAVCANRLVEYRQRQQAQAEEPIAVTLSVERYK